MVLLGQFSSGEANPQVWRLLVGSVTKLVLIGFVRIVQVQNHKSSALNVTRFVITRVLSRSSFQSASVCGAAASFNDDEDTLWDVRNVCLDVSS